MPDKVTIDVIPQFREAVFDLVSSYQKAKRDCRYADLRIEVSEGKVAVAENGMDKFSGEDYGFAFGVRVIAGDRISAPGYCGEMVGTSDLPRLNKRLSEALDHAYERAIANARAKEGARSRSAVLGDVLGDVTLAPVDVRQDTIDARYEIDPRELPLEDAIKYVREVSERVKGIDSGVAFNYISAYTQLEREVHQVRELNELLLKTMGDQFPAALMPREVV